MPESEVFHSPALYLGPLEVVERTSRSRRKLRGTVAKLWITKLLWTLGHRVPRRLHGSLLRLLALPVQLAAPLPGNQLLSACRTMSALAARAGYDHPPRELYRAFVDGARGALEFGVPAVTGDPDGSADRILVRRPDVLRDLLAEHGGCVLCVPHNTGAVLASLKVSRIVPTVLLAKNPGSIARTRAALHIYESLGVQALLVRDGNPFELARACLRTLRDGKLLVATVDRIHRDDDRILAPFFGGVASVGGWASKIAAKAQVPVLPAYTHAQRRHVELVFGEPLCSEEPDVLLGHYLRHIEGEILKDPASWSFLADRRWRWVLEDALAGSRRTDGGVLRPGRDRATLPSSRPLGS